jgi:hypothetical protein
MGWAVQPKARLRSGRLWSKKKRNSGGGVVLGGINHHRSPVKQENHTPEGGGFQYTGPLFTPRVLPGGDRGVAPGKYFQREDSYA